MIESSIDGTPAPSSRWRRLRSIEGAAVAGLIAAGGWALAVTALLDLPDHDAPEADVLDYYADVSTVRAFFYLQVVVFATIAFLWFVGVIRHRIGALEPRLFGTVFLGAGLLLAGMLLTGAAIAATPAVLAGETGEAVGKDIATTSRITSDILLGVMAPRLGSVFVISTATLGLRTGTISRWFVIVSYLTGLAMLLIVTLSEAIMYVFPAWMAAVSLYLLILSKEIKPRLAD